MAPRRWEIATAFHLPPISSTGVVTAQPGAQVFWRVRARPAR